MDRQTAIMTVRTVFQQLAAFGQEASREASRVKECLDLLENKDQLLTGREIRQIVEEVAGLMKTVQEHDAAERMPHEKVPQGGATTREKKESVH